jgi:hypothetical protein
MIVFDLLCSLGHRFEGWFGSPAEFAAQKRRRLVSCPTCGGMDVERVPSATRYNSGAESPTAERPPRSEAANDEIRAAQVLYSKVLDHILTRTEDVGEEFPAEARKIHYHKVPARAIRGQASEEEHEELLEEGVPVARLPVPPAKRLN